ncbi:MAG TPA: hypothetical protein PKI46_09430 [Bacteroidales bacterium]|nr:hypothetical protein [Bacteroidales bacterium]
MNKDILKQFLESFSETIDNENAELFKRIVEDIKIKDFENPEEFYIAVLYPWKKFIKGFLKATLNANYDIEFIYTQYRFIENHFQNVIEKTEGSACCADKSRTIVKAILNYYLTGEKIEFNYEQEYTYHLPKLVFTTHEDIISFYESLKSLHLGNSKLFLIQLLKIYSNEKDI